MAETGRVNQTFPGDGRRYSMNRTTLVFLAACLLAVSSVSQTTNAASPGKPVGAKKPLVTFVELGSVKCVPCRQMQPVMKAVEDKYGDQIKIVFYDVWQEENREQALTFKIRLIPTQVFLDHDGKELMRHEGFFPEADIDKFLQSKGLRPLPVVGR
jgi:thioredoxin 1